MFLSCSLLQVCFAHKVLAVPDASPAARFSISADFVRAEPDPENPTPGLNMDMRMALEDASLKFNDDITLKSVFIDVSAAREAKALSEVRVGLGGSFLLQMDNAKTSDLDRTVSESSRALRPCDVVSGNGETWSGLFGP